MASSGSQYKLVMQAYVDESQIRKQIKKISKSAKLKVDTKGAKKNVDSLGNSIVSITKKVVLWSVAVGGVYQAFNQLKKGITFISDLNNSMTQIQMVSGMTADETEKLAVEYNQLAKELSATTLQVSEGALEWVKQGKTAEEASKLVTNSIILSKLAMMESAQATEYLTSIMNGFKLETEDMIGVLDKLVAIDNESATSVAEIAEALRRSSSSARQAGVDFDSLTSYIATVSSVSRRSASSIGEAFKTMFARMQSVKLGAKFDEFGEDISNVEIVLRKHDIQLRDSVNEFRNLDDVIEELAGTWETLTTTEQQQIAEAIAGKRQRENFLVLMDNFNDALEYQDIAANAAGLALERYAIHQESVAAKSEKLQATWEELWMETLSSDTIKNVIDFATGLIEIVTALGGLDALLPGLIILLAAMNAELIIMTATSVAGSIAMMISNFGAFIALLPTIISGYSGITIAVEAMNVAFGTTAVLVGTIVAALYAVIKAYKEVERVLEIVEEGQEDVNDAWGDFFARVVEEEVSATDAMKRYRKGIDLVAEGYEKAAWYQKAFIDKQELLAQGLDDARKYIELNSDSYEEYIELHKELADIHGKLAGVALPRQAYEYRELIEWTNNATKSVGEYAEAQKEAIGTTGDLAETLSDLQDAFSSVNDIASKALKDGISYDDIVELSKHYDNYLDLLEIEGGLVTLNTDLLRDFNVAKAKAAVETAKFAGASEKEVAILENYVEQLERAVPMSRDYTKTLQELFSAQELIGSGMEGMSGEISALSDQYERGVISATTYFDEIKSRLGDLDVTEMFADNENAANIFFSGLAQEASASLVQISSMFDAGEITITEYTEQLGSLSGMFGNLGQMAMESGMLSQEGMGIVGQALEQIGIGTERLMNLQELNMQVQSAFVQTQAQNLQWGTQAYNDYMLNIANAAIQTGEVFTDLSGNAFSNSDDLYNYLVASESNFVTFADQTANKTGEAIQGIVQNVGDMLVTLGDAISNFSGTISIQPTLGTMVDFDAMIAGDWMNIFSIPSIDLQISSSGFEGIGAAVSSIGKSLQGMDFDFNADIYTAPMNQVRDAVGGAGGAYDSLANSINNATGAQQGLNDAVDEFRQKQIDALNEQLRLYGRVIDKRKDLLQTMVDEKKYQDELADKNKNLADMKNELLELQLDDSEEARAKRSQLESDIAQMEKDIVDFQFEEGIERQQAALDNEYEKFEDYIKQAIYLVKTIPGETEGKFLANLMDKLGYVPTQGIPMADISLPVPAFPGSAMAGSLSSSEMNKRLGSLTSGGYSGGIMGGMPSFGQTPGAEYMTNDAGESLSIDNLININVEGNLDEGAVAEIERIADMVIRRLNEGMNRRGIVRGAKTFSI